MKKILILFAIVLCVACKDPFEDNIAPTYSDYPIATLLALEPETYSLYLSLLRQADMYNTMNLSATYTSFVPTNEAIQKYLDQKGYASVSAISKEEAILLVKYHTIAGKKYTQSQFESGVIPDTTATGDYLSIEFREGGLGSIYVNGVSRIKKLDITATNGVVHSLDDVLIPVTETIWDRVNQDSYSMLAQIVKMTGYEDDLMKISEPVLNPTTGGYQNKRFYYTLFAVSDAVYRQNGIQNVNDLLSLLAVSGSNYTDLTNGLNKYVAYHLLNQQLDYASLSNFNGLETSKNISTMAQNELISLSTVQNQLMINYDVEAKSGVTILTENINAKNGMIHVVNSIMPVKVPPQLLVKWELTDYADLAGLYPNEYRKSNLAATVTKYLAPETALCYNWESVLGIGLVRYQVYYKSDLRYGMLNYDCLTLRLGLYSWIEMKTPAVVKGKYTLKVYYASLAGAKDGKFSVIIDGNYVGGEITTHGSSSTTSKLASSTIGTIEFSSTVAHTLRILQTDNTDIYLDYIEFTPVK